MKSIKPGRGSSGMNFVSTIGGVIFGVLWTVCAFAMTGGGAFGLIGLIFPLFGVVFVVIGIIQAVYHYKNATGKDRYSAFDITEDGEELGAGRRALGTVRASPAPGERGGVLPLLRGEAPGGFPLLPEMRAGAAEISMTKKSALPANEVP